MFQSNTRAHKPIVDRAFLGDGYRLYFNLPYKDRLFEAPTQTCAHCGSHVIMNPERKRTRGQCRRCGYVCDDCTALATCPAGGV